MSKKREDFSEGNHSIKSVEGRRNDASQPYRFGSRSVPRRSFSFDFAELVSPHTHTLRGPSAHPYIESGNRFSVLMYRPRVLTQVQPHVCTAWVASSVGENLAEWLDFAKPC